MGQAILLYILIVIRCVPLSHVFVIFTFVCLPRSYSVTVTPPPKRDISFDVLGVGFGFRVIPGGVFVCISPFSDDVIIARSAFPTADGVGFRSVRSIPLLIESAGK